MQCRIEHTTCGVLWQEFTQIAQKTLKTANFCIAFGGEIIHN